MSKRPCSKPGCPELSRENSQYCDDHLETTKERSISNKSSRSEDYKERKNKIYNTKRWKRLRKKVLKEQDGFCAWDGCTAPAEEVDHIKPLRHGGDPWARSNLQALCKRHHTIKTNKEFTEDEKKTGVTYTYDNT